MTDVLNFYTNLPLEERVKIDMRSMGYDPNNPADVEEFWEDRFEGETVISETEVNGTRFKITITPIGDEE